VAESASIDLSLDGKNASIKQISEHVQISTNLSYTPELKAYRCDVTSKEQVKDTWRMIIKDLGQVDVIVTATGIVQNFAAEDYPYDR